MSLILSVIRWSRRCHGDIGDPDDTLVSAQGRNYLVTLLVMRWHHRSQVSQSVTSGGTMRSSGWSLVIMMMMMMLNSGQTQINGARDGQTLIRRRRLLRPAAPEETDLTGYGGEHNTLSSGLQRFHNNTSGLSLGPRSHLMPASNRRRSLVKKKIKKIIKSKSRKSGGGRANLLSNNNTATANIGPSNSPSNTLENYNR